MHTMFKNIKVNHPVRKNQSAKVRKENEKGNESSTKLARAKILRHRVPKWMRISYSDKLSVFRDAFSAAVPRSHPSESLKDSVDRIKNTDSWSAIWRLRSSLNNEIFGTAEPSFHLQTAPYTMSSTVGGVTTFFFSLSFGIFADAPALTALFDEYSFVGPFEIIVRPIMKPSTNTSYNMIVGVIDYTDSALLTSTIEALTYDTAQVMVVDPYLSSVKPGSPDSGTCTWNGMLQGQPDKAWISTALSPAVAYWKTYNYTQTIPSSSNLCVVNAKAYIKMRQVGG